MQLAESALDAWLKEVGEPQYLTGRFQPGFGGPAAEHELSFLADSGDAFRVANIPAGAAMWEVVEVLTFPVKLSQCVPGCSQQSLWVICPWSYAQLEELRNGANGGLPSNVYMDATSGQVRCKPGSQM
jgi:hypothetical protein